MNKYLAKSDRTSIPGRRTSNRKGTALPSGSYRVGNNKFRLRGKAAETAAWWSNRAHPSMEGLGPQILNAAPNQGSDPISNSMWISEPAQFITYESLKAW